MTATIVLTALSSSAQAAGFDPPPASAASTAEIRAWVAERRGFGTPGWQEITAGSERVFVIWNLPTSGLDLNHVYTYHRQHGAWVLLDQLFVTGPPTIAVEYAPASSEVLYRKDDRVFRRLRVPALGR